MQLHGEDEIDAAGRRDASRFAEHRFRTMDHCVAADTCWRLAHLSGIRITPSA